jgi:uncharacterized protein (DUF1330 family)
MLERLLPGPLAAVYERDLPEPVHVPNLLTFSDQTWYRRYAAAVYPILRAVGGRPRWFGRHHRTYHGERQCQEFGLVEYPSHRRFLMMIGNPYYALINRLRERGVSHFEAGFTHPVADEPLGRHEFLLTVHFEPQTGRVDDDDFEAVREPVEAAGGAFVYGTRLTSDFDFLGEPTGQADPRPLSYPGIACFAEPSPTAADATVDELDDALGAATERHALCLYRRQVS